MTFMVGDVDIVSAIVNNDYQIRRALAILEWIANNNPGLRLPAKGDIASLESRVTAEIVAKYPSAQKVQG